MGEELLVVFPDTVKVPLLEMGDGGFQVQGAAHDVPGNDDFVLLRNPKDLLGEELKEGLPFDIDLEDIVIPEVCRSALFWESLLMSHWDEDAANLTAPVWTSSSLRRATQKGVLL